MRERINLSEWGRGGPTSDELLHHQHRGRPPTNPKQLVQGWVRGCLLCRGVQHNESNSRNRRSGGGDSEPRRNLLIKNLLRYRFKMSCKAAGGHSSGWIWSRTSAASKAAASAAASAARRAASAAWARATRARAAWMPVRIRSPRITRRRWASRRSSSSSSIRCRAAQSSSRMWRSSALSE